MCVCWRQDKLEIIMENSNLRAFFNLNQIGTMDTELASYYLDQSTMDDNIKSTIFCQKTYNTCCGCILKLDHDEVSIFI